MSDKSDKADKVTPPKDQLEIPKLVRYTCPSCGKQAVSKQGATILCETCCNAFLARNVGIMTEDPE
jgi:ribosomal protein L37AE/L43A